MWAIQTNYITARTMQSCFESVQSPVLRVERRIVNSPRKCHMVRTTNTLEAGHNLARADVIQTLSRWPTVRCTDDIDRAIVAIDSLTGTLTMVVVDEREMFVPT